MQYIQQPQAIEAKSFDIISEIIAETRPDYRFASPLHEAIIKRVIHTTADFDWLDILWFSPDALIALSEALSRPCTLYTDTTMALSGINKTLLARFGGECRCYISDPRVVREAQSRGMTRSMAAVDIAVQEPGEKVFVFGNAPTALFRLLEHREAFDRLFQEIRRPRPHGVIAHIGIARDRQDRWRIAAEGADLVNQLGSAAIGQAHVDDDHRRTVGLQMAHRAAQAVGAPDPGAGAQAEQPHRFGGEARIFDDQHGQS